MFHMMIAFHSGYPLDHIKSLKPTFRFRVRYTLWREECLLYLSFPHPKVPTLLSSFSSHSSHLLHFQVFCFREKKKHLKWGIRLKKMKKRDHMEQDRATIKSGIYSKHMLPSRIYVMLLYFVLATKWETRARWGRQRKLVLLVDGRWLKTNKRAKWWLHMYFIL